jgi:hypothetical protein
LRATNWSAGSGETDRQVMHGGWLAGTKEFDEWVRSTTSNSNAAVDTDEKRLLIEGSMEIRGRCIRRNTKRNSEADMRLVIAKANRLFFHCEGNINWWIIQ